jgi:hypothetical protein
MISPRRKEGQLLIALRDHNLSKKKRDQLLNELKETRKLIQSGFETLDQPDIDMSQQGEKPKKKGDPSRPVEEKALNFSEWITKLYDDSVKISNDDLYVLYESIRYKGFDRTKILKQLRIVIEKTEIVMELVLVTALQGPVKAAKQKLSNGFCALDYKIPASGGKGTEDITCARIAAATADLAAFLLKRLNVPKRIPSHPCPAWLQFPSAGSILMPDDLRQVHIDWSKKFSLLIGGVFNEQIYSTMMQNAYIDSRLQLFS